MKKSLLFLAAAALTLASCSSDETTAINESVANANEISFRAFTNGVTRAAANTKGSKTAFVENDDIDVWAAYYDGSTTMKYFQDDFTMQASGGSLTGFYSGDKHYWPDLTSSKTLTFTAVYGATDAYGNLVKQSAAGTVSHTPNATAANQTDVLLAQGQATSSTTTADKFVLNFRHALSQIVVKAINSNPSLKIVITGVRIGYIKTAGTLTYIGGLTTANATLIAQGNWACTAFSGSTIAKSYKYDQTVSLTMNGQVTTAQELGSSWTPWILLPQNMTDGAGKYTTQNSSGSPSDDPDLAGSYIALQMEIYNWNGTAEAGLLKASQWCYWPITTNWNPGYKYTYTVDAANGGYEPTDNDNDKELDPVLGNYIVFSPSCTIDTWVDNAGAYTAVP